MSTQLEIDEVLEDHPDAVKTWDTVVMIQCVGSRTPENPNCSRICCQTAIKNALRIHSLNPDVRMFILYRDMRTYGLREDLYVAAREQGVLFSRYSRQSKPVVTNRDGRLNLEFFDSILGRTLSSGQMATVGKSSSIRAIGPCFISPAG